MTGAAQTAPYGTWVSPVTTDLVAGRTVGLGALAADGSDLLWLEGRPAEAGRTVLVRRRADGGIADLTPPPFDVASRVHEYGGGAMTARDGLVVFSNKPDGAVWLIEGDAAPRPVARVPGCRYADFAVLPGGRHVVCVREDHRDRPPTDPQAAIVALDLNPADAASNAGAVLVQGADFYSSPRPSPDGTRLAWLAWDHPDMPWDGTRLYAASLAGTTLGPPALLAGETREALVQPAWSPAGVLHVCSDRSGWWNVYRLGDGLEPVCPMPAETGGPHWVFGQRWFDFLPDGRIIATISQDAQLRAVLLGPDGPASLGREVRGGCPVVLPGALAWIAVTTDAPPAIVLAPFDGQHLGPPEVLRRSGPAVLGADEVSVGESIRFPTPDFPTPDFPTPDFPTGDGAGQAFFYPPCNPRYQAPAGERPPLVVISHGGPTGMTSNGFSPAIQWWTSRGIAVVDVNYGGSTGFGRAWRRRLEGQWGVVDVADCIAAAEHLVATGRVDGARLAIRGGSAGGFTTLAALTQSTTFRAGASLYGVADLKLLAADTHKFESRYLDGLIGRLPEDEAVYVARSPINHIDRLSCPVIFFQGLDDKVVPPNQASVMVQAMRARGLKVAHYEFAGEAHGFRRGETVRRVLELELDFYGQVFGFVAPGLSERAILS